MPRNDRKVHNTVLEVLRRKIGKGNKISLRAQILCELVRLCLKFRKRCILMPVLCKYVRQLRLRHGILSRERIACNPDALLSGHVRLCSKGRRCTDGHCHTGDKKEARGMSSDTLHAHPLSSLMSFHPHPSLHTSFYYYLNVIIVYLCPHLNIYVTLFLDSSVPFVWILYF